MNIVAALTDGDNDDITIGRNAVFMTVKGMTGRYHYKYYRQSNKHTSGILVAV